VLHQPSRRGTLPELCDNIGPQLHYLKTNENTANRQIVEKESHAVTQGFRAFHIYLPTKEGRCQVGISFKAMVPEDLMKGIAASATLTK
jgi:hypothetical protein